MNSSRSNYKGLLLDFGGVITTDFFGSIDDHCERLGLPRGRFRNLITDDPAGRTLYHRIERGEISQSDFERELAQLLSVDSTGLVAGLLAGLCPDQQIVETAASARAAGIRVGVVTNSWGTTPYDPYAPYHLHDRYDAVIVSGEIGVRKPDPTIYRVAAEKLGLSATECVFVDDVAVNLPPAAALGMATVHHVDTRVTVAKLERLFGVNLAELVAQQRDTRTHYTDR